MDFWQYPTCSTCVKARKFLTAYLEEQGADVAKVLTLHDLVKEPPTAAHIEKMHRASGRELKAFFNTAGQSYRNGGFKDRVTAMSDAEKYAALAADGKLIKRPILEVNQMVVVGFREQEWRDALAS